MSTTTRAWTTGRLVVAVAVAALVTTRSLRRVTGGSMRPTLDDGDLVLVVPLLPLRVGDLVVLRDPREPSRQTVKRLVALAGDPATFHDGPGTVPAGHVAVEGDDPRASTDSRHYGPVARDLVVGRAFALSRRPSRAHRARRLPRARASAGLEPRGTPR